VPTLSVEEWGDDGSFPATLYPPSSPPPISPFKSPLPQSWRGRQRQQEQEQEQERQEEMQQQGQESNGDGSSGGGDRSRRSSMLIRPPLSPQEVAVAQARFEEACALAGDPKYWLGSLGSGSCRRRCPSLWQQLPNQGGHELDLAGGPLCVSWAGMVRLLQAAGQLEVVGGGWVSHDEALPSLVATMDQLTLGRRALLEAGLPGRTRGLPFFRSTWWLDDNDEKEAGKIGATGSSALDPYRSDRPLDNDGIALSTPLLSPAEVSWQLDPFGHSATTARIFAMLGYQAHVINRVPYATKAAMRRKGNLNFVWRFIEQTAPFRLNDKIAHGDNRINRCGDKNNFHDHGQGNINTDYNLRLRSGILTCTLNEHYAFPEFADFEAKIIPYSAAAVATTGNALVRAAVAQAQHHPYCLERVAVESSFTSDPSSSAISSSLSSTQSRYYHRRYQHRWIRHVLMPMGDDFRFHDARSRYLALDQIVTYLNVSESDGCKFATSCRRSDLQSYKLYGFLMNECAALLASIPFLAPKLVAALSPAF
jgi:hypothetical protein